MLNSLKQGLKGDQILFMFLIFIADFNCSRKREPPYLKTGQELYLGTSYTSARKQDFDSNNFALTQMFCHKSFVGTHVQTGSHRTLKYRFKFKGSVYASQPACVLRLR